MSAVDFYDEVKLVLADDHEVVRAGLRRLLSIEKKIKVLDEANNGFDAVELVKYYKPDVTLLDIMMPRMDGIEAAKQIKALNLNTKVLILTAFEDSSHVELALSAGADGYLTKDISARELVDSINKVLSDERVFSRSIIQILEKKFVPYSEEPSDQQVSISKREQEILNLVAKGKTSPEIGEELFISVRTVQSHRANIMQKLGIKNAAGLVRYALFNLGKNS